MSDMIFDSELNEEKTQASSEKNGDPCLNTQELELNIRLDQNENNSPELSVNLKVNKENPSGMKVDYCFEQQKPEPVSESGEAVPGKDESEKENTQPSKNSTETEPVELKLEKTEVEDEVFDVPVIPKKKDDSKEKSSETEEEYNPPVVPVKTKSKKRSKKRKDRTVKQEEKEIWSAESSPSYVQNQEMSNPQFLYETQVMDTSFGQQPSFTQAEPVQQYQGYPAEYAMGYGQQFTDYNQPSYMYQPGQDTSFQQEAQSYQSQPVEQSQAEPEKKKTKKGLVLPYTLFGITAAALIGLGVWFYMVHSESSSLQTQLAQAQSNASDLERMNESYQSEIGDLNTQIDELETKVDDLTQELEDKNQELDELINQSDDDSDSENMEYWTADEFLDSIEKYFDEENWQKVVEEYGQMASRYPDEEQTQTAYNYYAQAQQHLQSDGSST